MNKKSVYITDEHYMGGEKTKDKKKKEGKKDV